MIGEHLMDGEKDGIRNSWSMDLSWCLIEVECRCRS